jgi:hypothetical protein
MAGAAQVLKHPQYRVGDSIDVGEKRFRDDCDSHEPTVASPGVADVACRNTAGGGLLSVQRIGSTCVGRVTGNFSLRRVEEYVNNECNHRTRLAALTLQIAE